MQPHKVAIACGAVLASLLLLPPAAHAANLPYLEPFDGANGAPWPAPWFAGSTHVTVSDLQGNRARLNGDPAFVARMILPGFAESDVEVEVTVEFEDVDNQGFGFYARQNGGTLQEYIPHGQGYAMFLKGDWFWPQDLGLWREIDGVETQFAWGNDPVAGGLQDLMRYRLRYRVTQSNPTTTLLQARVWPEGSSEPVAWTIESFDTRPELQGTPGSFAIDIYNYSGFGHIFIDDLSIRRFPDPTSVPAVAGAVPSAAPLLLSTPRPHPVIGSAKIDLVLPERAETRLSLYDVSGRFVARLFDGPLAPGAITLSWDPVDHDAHRLAPGVYLLRLEAGARGAARRIVIVE